MIFNVSSPSGGKTPVYPQYTGTMNVVYLNDDATAGYAEFTSSGTLSWVNDQLPKGVKFDLFCVGGGAGGACSPTYEDYHGWAGGGSGFTTTVTGVVLGEAETITIGAGGNAGTSGGLGSKGGATSIGTLCSAEGGKPPSDRTTGGNGGSGGARGGGNQYTGGQSALGGNGGTNGGDATGGVYGTNGKGQGTPTTDLLGRVHAGGGSGGNGYYLQSPKGEGGASDFTSGKGADAATGAGGRGGGGYGGGGAGGGPNSNGYGSGYAGGAGGQGFAMIAWGDYKELFNRTAELEYIESTGTQYINTGLSMPNGYVAKMKVRMTATSANAQAVIGAIDDSSPYHRNYFAALQNLSKWNVGAYDDLACGSAISVGKDYELEISTVHGNVYCKVDGVAQSIGTPSAATRSAKNIYLFDVNYPYPMPANMRMYYCQIFDNAGNLVRDYVPAVRVRDNAIGLYDRVGEKLYTNAGTGQFVIGVKAENVTELEYMGVTGLQWVDTEYTPLSDDVVYECEWTETTLNSNCTLFGSQNTSSSNKFSAVQYKPTATSMYSATGATDRLATIDNIAANVRNTLTVTVKNGTVTRVQNGATASGAYGGTIKNGLNVFLFADNVNGSAGEKCNAVRIHSWKVTDGGALLRDLIPATAFGVVGFYDRVTKRMYTNAGTGSFVAGGEV